MSSPFDLQPEEFEKNFKAHPGAVLLDVRTEEEYDSGHLPGAVNIDIMSPDFMEQAEGLEKGKAYYVYCRSGGRSSNAVRFLKKLGHEEVFNLAGGILAWQGEVE